MTHNRTLRAKCDKIMERNEIIRMTDDNITQRVTISMSDGTARRTPTTTREKGHDMQIDLHPLKLEPQEPFLIEDDKNRPALFTQRAVAYESWLGDMMDDSKESAIIKPVLQANCFGAAPAFDWTHIPGTWIILGHVMLHQDGTIHYVPPQDEFKAEDAVIAWLCGIWQSPDERGNADKDTNVTYKLDDRELAETIAFECVKCITDTGTEDYE